MARDRESLNVVVRSGGVRTAILAALIVLGVLALVAAIPSLNPFATERVDRSGPAVLKSIERLSEYRAATAHLEQVVDIEDDARYLPDFLKGEKTLLVAAGDVDAFVDFSALGPGAVRISEDRRAATLTLPAPQLSKPRLDLARSRVYDRDRGLLDRLESIFEDSPTEDRSVLLLAEEKLAAAAAEDGGVLTAAETNTRAMLTELLRGLGFTSVTVRFQAPPPS
ncbi:MAG TPA: DUF4230 domain-containing protein [Solirubrobacteraceae bacterium]|nr:DUF4230 domain-containing protein [Solirubrobacteraceae bacterium]